MVRGTQTIISIFVATLAVYSTSTAQEQKPSPPAVNWQRGPGVAKIGDTAEIKLPQGYLFAGASDTKAILESLQNPTSGNEVGFLAKEEWFVVFEFDDVGYVKDDEKNNLNPDALLDTFRRGNEAANKERSQRGWPALNIVGWEEKPNYDPATNNLQWCIRAESEGKPVVNYNTRLLGRHGVMSANLVVEPDKLKGALPTFKGLLQGYSFNPGNKYGEYRSGDKVAAYGLAALVTGGAAAVALKTGLLQKLIKPLIVGIAALALGLKKIFTRKKPESA